MNTIKHLIYLAKLILTKIKSIIFTPNYKFIKTNDVKTVGLQKISYFRIEVEEIIAYNIFDKNKDGLVTQDEINVS